jgi:hypothetical protein
MWIESQLALYTILSVHVQNYVQQRYGYVIFFNLCFIGPVGFDDHLIDSSSSILFASASFGGGCSAGVYQQIVKNIDTYN